MQVAEEILPITDEIKKYFQNYFLPQVNGFINEQIKFIKNYDELIEIYKRRYNNNPQPDDEFVNNLKLSFHQKSYEAISKKYDETQKQTFDQYFTEFVREIDSYLKSIDENIIRVQEKERFIINENDRFRIKFLKRVKIVFYNISQLPVKFGNIFRKLFHKTLKEKRLWYHKIPLRDLTAFYLNDITSLRFLPSIDDLFKKVSAVFVEVWKADEIINKLSVNEKEKFNFEISKQVDELKELPGYLVQSFEEIFNETIISYDDAFRKAGTIELPLNKISTKKNDKNHKKLNNEYESLYNGWTNTFYSLFEDWRLNKELNTLSEKLKSDFRELLKQSKEKFDKNISPYLNQIKEFINEVIYRLNEFSGSSSEVKSLLYREKDRIHNKLSKILIPETSDVILNQNIPDLIDRMENNVNNGIKTLPEKRAIVKTASYDERIKESEIDYISPKEIITYSALPSYIKVSSNIKSSIMQELDEIQKSLKDIDQIADFNLESALSMFKADKNTFEDPIDIAIEGINRAIAKEDSLEKKLNDIGSKINKELYEALIKVDEELSRQTQNENIIEIKLKIARTKTLQRTEELKQKSVHFIKNFFPIIVNAVKREFISIKNYYKSIRKKFGITSRPASISSEISDFLAETENAVSRLPFVYQRLFRIEPLEDERFFEKREKELSLLFSAHEKWKLKRYAPVIIFGEKGSGATTLLNFFFRHFDSNYNITRTVVGKNIFREKDFIDFLKNIFKKDTFNNVDDAALYLNSQVTKQVVVVENLQNLFLKKVNGFICLKMLFELISKTNQNVFWIVTSSLYAWNYLSKVMNVPDYFGYLVKIEQLSDEQIIEIILKRHRISGYNIYFETENEPSKKNKNLSDSELQEYLKKEYFSELNKFAKSNISLALLFWMRSTKEVTANAIKISSVVQIDFSFFSTIDSDKVFILYILLLHDGLTVEDAAEILNKPLKEIKLKLLVLLDDGIIIRKGELYQINPLLYRQIVSLLQSKNIIH